MAIVVDLDNTPVFVLVSVELEFLSAEDIVFLALNDKKVCLSTYVWRKSSNLSNHMLCTPLLWEDTQKAFTKLFAGKRTTSSFVIPLPKEQ